MIVVRIMGGLGNQMFQYSTGLAVAKRLKTELWLDLSHYDGDKNRSFRLNYYKINEQIISPLALENMLRDERKSVKHTPWKDIVNRFSYGGKRKVIFREKGFNYDPEVCSLEGDVYLDGYWQSYKYFCKINQEIKNIFNLRVPVEGVNADLAHEMEGVNSVCLHFRRGDYYSNWKARAVHGVNLTDYYSNAMSTIEDRISNPYFFVFSDDIAWTKKNVVNEHPIKFVDINPMDEPERDLYLMSKCRHHIIANSTFSWWGAWLAQQNGIVIAPRRWFRWNRPVRDLIPESWLIL